jgi:polyisoprenoid-binding protein YceI
MKRFARLCTIAALFAFTLPARAADTYKGDPVHSSVIFRIAHVNISYLWGRFNDPSSTFTLDEADVTKSSFDVEIQVNNVDTHNAQRDAHLKTPDFFDVKRFPTIHFKSTAVKKGDAANKLQVTGDLTMHGVTKRITIPVEITGKGQFPPGSYRVGLEATFSVKRTDYDIKGIPAMPAAVGDEVKLVVAIEGERQ